MNVVVDYANPTFTKSLFRWRWSLIYSFKCACALSWRYICTVLKSILLAATTGFSFVLLFACFSG